MPDCDAWEYLACPRHRDEQPRAVADDLGEAALVLVPVEAIGREPGQFKALFAAYQRALNGEWIVACEAQRFAAGKDTEIAEPPLPLHTSCRTGRGIPRGSIAISRTVSVAMLMLPKN